MRKSKSIWRKIVTITGFMVIFTAMIMLVAPVIFTALGTDWGHPLSLTWHKTQVTAKTGKQTGPDSVKTDKAEEKKVDVQYGGDVETNVKKYQLEILHLPFYLKAATMYKTGLILFLFYFFLMGSAYKIRMGDNGDIDDRVITNMFAAFVLTAVIVFVLPIYHSHTHDYRADLESTICQGKNIVIAMSPDDDKLVAGALDNYKEELLAATGISVLGLAIFGLAMGCVCTGIYHAVFYGLLRPCFRVGVSWTKTMMRRYEDRIFRDVFQQQRNSIFAKYVDENGEQIMSQLLQKRKDQVQDMGAELTRQLRLNSELIEILPTGVVEIVRYGFTVEWRPFPVFMPRREVISQISMDNFFRHLVSQTKEEAFVELRDKIFSRYHEHFKAAGEQARRNFVSAFAQSAQSVFEKKRAEAQAEQLGASQKLVEKLLHVPAERSLRKFKNELGQISRQDMGAMIQGLKKDLTQEVINNVDPLLRSNRGGNDNGMPTIIPPETRFCINQGNCQVVVVEQPPTIRNIFVSSERSKPDSYQVALPFVIFVISFRDNEFDNLWLYYRNKPLQSLDDQLFIPNFSNLDSNCSVCLKFPGGSAGDLSGKVREIITHFWNSPFNTDLSHMFQQYAQREPKLEGYATWEKQSRKDPLFPLKINWIPSISLHDRLLDLIRRTDNEDVPLGKIREKIEAAFRASQDEMQEALKRRFSLINVRGKSSELITQAVNEQLGQIIRQLSQVLSGSFSQAVFDEHQVETLARLYDSSAKAALEDEFSHLAREVLFRRRIEVGQLIQNIKHEARR